MRILVLMMTCVVLGANMIKAQEGGELEPIVVEASRSNDTAGDMNKDVTVITSGDIEASPDKNLPQLLSDVAGLDARTNSSIKDTQINMGQFGESSMANVLVLVDGRRLNTADLAAPDLSLIDLNTVDHIEIIQGAGTVLYGDNADGGVINIVTKKGIENTKPSVLLTSEVGSYKGTKEGMCLTGGLSKLAYQFDYAHQQSNNYRTNDDYWANDYNARLGYNPTDIFGIDFAQGYHLDRYRLPGAISTDQINAVGVRGVNPGSISYGTTSDSHFDLTPHLRFEEGQNRMDLSLFTSFRKTDNNVVYPNFPEVLNYERESYEFQPKFIWSIPLTDHLDNKLTGGYDYIYYKENRRVNSTGSPQDMVDAREASQGVYLLDELTMDRKWLLNAGVRGAWSAYNFHQTQPQNQLAKLFRSDTTEGYEGGLGYRYNPRSKIFLNYAHTYRLPNLDEFFQYPFPGFNGSAINTGLTFQKGNQYQLGIKDNTFRDIHLGFIATEAQYKNEIYDDLIDPSAVFANANYNARTRHYSEEGDIAADLFAKRLSPYANITFQQACFISGLYSGNQIPDVPDHLAHAGVIYRPLPGLSTKAQITFVGKRFGIGDDQNIYAKVKRYETVDWNIKYNYKNMEFWFALNNIFNRRYFIFGTSYAAASNDEAYYPAPGRNVAAGLKVRF